jgi:membrane-bound ClpP family serine protease
MSVLFWPMLFLALGLLLLIAEVFIPSGGFIGLSSVVCLVLSLWYAFQQSAVMGASFMLIDLVVLPATAAFALSLWSRSPLARRVFLKPPTPDEIGVSHADHHLEHLVGQIGRALTPLRPSGHIEIEGRRVDGLAEEGFLPSGALVRVIRIRSGQLVVRGLLNLAEDIPGPWQAEEPVPGTGPSGSSQPVGASAKPRSAQVRSLTDHDQSHSRRHGDSAAVSTTVQAVTILEEAP